MTALSTGGAYLGVRSSVPDRKDPYRMFLSLPHLDPIVITDPDANPSLFLIKVLCGLKIMVW